VIPGVRFARRAGNRLATLLPGPLGDEDQDASQFVPPAVMSSASRVTLGVLARSPMPALNLVISNVPGPREPLYCAGAEMVA
jgi:hypothetical protein